ncbi:hypothetical protein [Roseibium sp. M-1]
MKLIAACCPAPHYGTLEHSLEQKLQGSYTNKLQSRLKAFSQGATVSNSDRSDLDKIIYRQLLGCSILLVVLFGIAHNIFLSAGDPITGPRPSTHPLTAFGFAVFACAIFFRTGWEQARRTRFTLCWLVIGFSALRIAEALFPNQVNFISAGPMAQALESAGLFGRFSLQTAVFLVCCFCFELSQKRHHAIRVLLVSLCLVMLSLGITETLYSLFLWGNELSLITLMAMFLVSIDLLFRIRHQQPLQSFLQSGKTSFYLQFTGLALYLLPMIVGTVLLRKMQVSPMERAPFEAFFALTSCVLLGAVVLLSSYLDRHQPHQPACENNTDGRKRRPFKSYWDRNRR